MVLGLPALEDGQKEDFKSGADMTGVVTTVMFRSRLGEKLRRVRNGESAEDEPKKGFLASWSTSGIQRSIEAIASRKTENQLGKAKEGMNVVLERLRGGGLVAVLEGMRKDRQLAFGSVPA